MQSILTLKRLRSQWTLTMPYYLTPKQDDYNQIPELQVCIAEALYDVDSIVADPGAYTKKALAREWVAVIKSGAEMIGHLRSLIHFERQ